MLWTFSKPYTKILFRKSRVILTVSQRLVESSFLYGHFLAKVKRLLCISPIVECLNTTWTVNHYKSTTRVKFLTKTWLCEEFRVNFSMAIQNKVPLVGGAVPKGRARSHSCGEGSKSWKATPWKDVLFDEVRALSVRVIPLLWDWTNLQNITLTQHYSKYSNKTQKNVEWQGLRTAMLHKVCGS